MHLSFALSPLSDQTLLGIAITASAATRMGQVHIVSVSSIEKGLNRTRTQTSTWSPKRGSRERGLWEREWVWTKRGVGHDLGHGQGHGPPYGLSYGPAYGLPVANFVKTRLSVAVNLCKQRSPSICHIYDSLSSSWWRFARIFVCGQNVR